MKRLLGAFALVFALATTSLCGASNLAPNFTGLWWNPAESGWGVNFDHQGDVVAATFFVYGQNNQPTWYIGVMLLQGTAPNGVVTLTGDLFQTTGPWLAAGTFNPAAVTQRKVGTVTFAGTTDGATLSYSVDGSLVTKQIIRQTLRDNSPVGTYLGATSDVSFGCSPASRNGIKTDDVGAITITRSGNTVTITAPTCTFRGTYSQQGQTGRIDGGTYICSTGAQGVLTFSDIYVEQSGIIGKYVGFDNSCNFSGTIAGARRQ